MNIIQMINSQDEYCFYLGENNLYKLLEKLIISEFETDRIKVYFLLLISSFTKNRGYKDAWDGKILTCTFVYYYSCFSLKIEGSDPFF